MKSQIISSFSGLQEFTEPYERVFLLLYKRGTERSECALQVLEKLDYDIKENTVILTADVNIVRDIHIEYGIETVPSLLELRKGKLVNIFKGCNSSDFYINALEGSQIKASAGEDKKQSSVTVYSSPSCTWCNTLKSYLKERKVQFRDIDVSTDQKAAEQMVNKSGQQGVPQIDIDGQIIVGFDKNRIDNLLKPGK